MSKYVKIDDLLDLCRMNENGNSVTPNDFMRMEQIDVVFCRDCVSCDMGTDEEGRRFWKCIGAHYGGTYPGGFCSEAVEKPAKEKLPYRCADCRFYEIDKEKENSAPCSHTGIGRVGAEETACVAYRERNQKKEETAMANHYICKEDVLSILEHDLMFDGEIRNQLIDRINGLMEYGSNDFPKQEQVRINLNDYIIVKLTAYGVKAHFEYFSELNRKSCPQIVGKDETDLLFPEIDIMGRSRYQIWEFMRIFGKYFHLGDTRQVIESYDVLVYDPLGK